MGGCRGWPHAVVGGRVPHGEAAALTPSPSPRGARGRAWREAGRPRPSCSSWVLSPSPCWPQHNRVLPDLPTEPPETPSLHQGQAPGVQPCGCCSPRSVLGSEPRASRPGQRLE